MLKLIFLCIFFSTFIKTQGDTSGIPKDILSQLNAKAAEGGQEEDDGESTRERGSNFAAIGRFPQSQNTISPIFAPRLPYSPCDCWFNIWRCFVPVMRNRLRTIMDIYNQLSGLSCYQKKQVLFCYVNQLLSRCRNRWFEMIARAWFTSYINSLC